MKICKAFSFPSSHSDLQSTSSIQLHSQKHQQVNSSNNRPSRETHSHIWPPKRPFPKAQCSWPDEHCLLPKWRTS